jgi:hypothetical protein
MRWCKKPPPMKKEKAINISSARTKRDARHKKTSFHSEGEKPYTVTMIEVDAWKYTHNDSTSRLLFWKALAIPKDAGVCGTIAGQNHTT